MAAAGIPTVTPLPLGDGSRWTFLASGHPAELEPFLAWDTRMNTDALVERGFGVLAAMHDALRAAHLPAAAATAPYANDIDPLAAVDASRYGVRRIHGWRDRQLSEFADTALARVELVAQLEQPLRDAQRPQDCPRRLLG